MKITDSGTTTGIPDVKDADKNIYSSLDVNVLFKIMPLIFVKLYNRKRTIHMKISQLVKNDVLIVKESIHIALIEIYDAASRNKFCINKREVSMPVSCIQNCKRTAKRKCNLY